MGPVRSNHGWRHWPVDAEMNPPLAGLPLSPTVWSGSHLALLPLSCVEPPVGPPPSPCPTKATSRLRSQNLSLLPLPLSYFYSSFCPTNLNSDVTHLPPLTQPSTRTKASFCSLGRKYIPFLPYQQFCRLICDPSVGLPILLFQAEIIPHLVQTHHTLLLIPRSTVHQPKRSCLQRNRLRPFARNNVCILPLQCPTTPDVGNGRRLPQPPWRAKSESTAPVRLPELPETVSGSPKHEGADRVDLPERLPNEIRGWSVIRPRRRHGVLPRPADRKRCKYCRTSRNHASPYHACCELR